ncbi:MAG: bifunctional 4-hydroxy-3-methylbut-2-enyl diphosphate reductase/30S ribosomal protein S1 [Pelosinus sp.]|nr:bifunctional 4-hydroxy-3-methylbut-2-enyl diphosphate reductase/30S ribosomal protein S1 [Pelosinus sp.]
MKILLAEHRGFCYGVKRAVQLADECAKTFDNAYTLGPIIHNPQMVKRLAQKGVQTIDDLAEISAGTVVIRSHGVGPEVYKLAEEKALHIIDATCPHVKKAQQEAHKLALAGYQVIVVGDKHHPEVKSIVEWAGQAVIVIAAIEEALALSPTAKLGVVAQTTFPAQEFAAIVHTLCTKASEIKVCQTICTATEERQQAARNLSAAVDAMIVIGGKNSANTTHLAEICVETGNPVYHIETAAELKQDWFRYVKTVGITAGASTPDWLIEEAYNKMQEFNQMLEQDLNQGLQKLERGSIIKGKVVGIRKDEVFIDVGHKAEGLITLTELAYPVPENAAEVVSEGQEIDCMVLEPDASDGTIRLSKVQADKVAAWDKLTEAFQNKKPVEGKILKVVKGGLTVAVFGIQGFLPGSQLALRYVEDMTEFIDQTLLMLPIELDIEKHRAVFSRKVLLQQEKEAAEQRIFASLAEGQTIVGTVSRLASFGAFVDIGGVDGLVHISDLSWQRVNSPEEVVAVGEKVEVLILKVDAQAKKISLSLKQVQRDPWFDLTADLAENQIVAGKVTKLAKFGAFVEIKPQVEGLVHLSELSDKRVASAEEVVTVGQMVIVKILGIDRTGKKISLSLVKAKEDQDRAEYQTYLGGQESIHTTIGDKLGDLLKSLK